MTISPIQLRLTPEQRAIFDQAQRNLTREQRNYLALTEARRNVARGHEQKRLQKSVRIKAFRALDACRVAFQTADAAEPRNRDNKNLQGTRAMIIAELERLAGVR